MDKRGRARVAEVCSREEPGVIEGLWPVGSIRWPASPMPSGSPFPGALPSRQEEGFSWAVHFQRPHVSLEGPATLNVHSHA